MRIVPKSGQEWLKFVLFPFKTYTVLAYFTLRIWTNYLPSHGDYTEVGAGILLGYILSFLVLCLGGIIQKSIGPKRTYQITYAFAAIDLIFIWLTLPYLASV